MSPPPLPPPPPPNPWTGRQLRQSQGTNFSSIWPHRLLHVPSMTSYVREGSDTYNCAKAPQYNVLSYTWGNFLDSTATAISVNGVDWPIPAIQKGHFTADAFKTAIERAARGVRHHCEWLWVDIACIPQKHTKETKEARNMRGQEIGRQVEIFRRAQEAFAWLSHLKASELSESQPLTTVDDFLAHANQGGSIRGVEDAANYLDTCDSILRLLEAWMSKFLSHPWLSSLWTLQEMVLRRDAWILFDDGLLLLYPGNARPKSRENKAYPWNFVQVKNDIFALRSILHREEIKFLENAEAITLSGNGEKKHKVSALQIRERLKKLFEVQVDKGLDALSIAIPHTAYSAAQHRNARELTDRIYGIVQTYEISCDPDPAGEDEPAKLRNLEDEFGTKLVAKSALLSQLFIHSANEPPRRSWLITQKCTVDTFWEHLYSSDQIVNEFGSLNVLGDTRNIKFHGKAWNLDFFFESTDEYLFRPGRGSPEHYLGLMLDHHVSKEVVGQVVDYFDSRESMLHAVKSLHEHYGGYVRIALLGSGSPPNLPVVRYVGLVLAPLEHTKGGSTWMRIGLVRWMEVYTTDPPSPHYHLPTYHDFQCVIT